MAKEPGESNQADIGTKHFTEDVMLRHLTRLNCEFREGRPDSCAKVIAGVESCDSASEWKSNAPAKDNKRTWVPCGQDQKPRKDKGARAMRVPRPLGGGARGERGC